MSVGRVKRADFNLRTRFPGLKTKIYRKGPYTFVISISKTNKIEEIKKVFDHEIRPLSYHITISDCAPEENVAEIEPITDSDIVSSFEGLILTSSSVYNHMLYYFPSLEFGKIDYDFEEKCLKVETVADIRKEESAKIVDIVESHFGYPCRVVTGEIIDPQKLPQPYKMDIMSIPASRTQPHLREALERDERIWYNNIENIYSGDIKEVDLFFLKDNVSSCYVNYALFHNINIRNLVLLYDLIYISLPLAADMDNFLCDQKITKDDLLYLVKTGRLVILNIQPELRLDISFLEQIYDVCADAVVTRRAISTLIAIDINKIHTSYIKAFGDHDLDSILSIFDESEISKLISWPIYGRNQSLSTLHHFGPLWAGSFGVNNAFSFSEELDFEFSVHANGTHLAHALRATYYPFYEKDYNIYSYVYHMNNLLRFYSSISPEDSYLPQSLTEELKFKHPGHLANELVSIFEVNEYSSLEDFVGVIKSKSQRSIFHSLFTQIYSKDKAQRSETISKYNQLINNMKGIVKIKDFCMETGSEFMPPGSGIALKILNSLIDKARRKNLRLEGIANHIETLKARAEGEKGIALTLLKSSIVVRFKKNYS